MKYRVGNDVTQISRFNDKINNEAFIIRLLSKIELNEYQKLPLNNKSLFLAKRWAFKEAFLKMRGWGIEHKKIFIQLTLINKKNTKPFVLNEDVDVSISHEQDLVFITCIEEEKC